MKTTTCDICGREISHQYPPYNDLTRTAILSKIVGSEPVETREFDFTISVTKFKFNCTGFDVCAKCVLDAMMSSFQMKTSSNKSACKHKFFQDVIKGKRVTAHTCAICGEPYKTNA